VDLGKREFESNCASCHGLSGKGGGYAVEWLRKSPTDLTTLTKRNGGVFPVSRMYESIEGGNVASHGSRDMPVWGQDYRTKAAEYYVDVPYDPETYVRSRILALMEYINRLQEK
jgi:mono/diheme cytochrome c family protein